MYFKIHRGTEEIGGSCVEIWTDQTRILVDFGLPLVNKDGSSFDFRKYEDLPISELVNKRILPDVKGIYKTFEKPINGILISHAHQDHYGLTGFIREDVQFFLGEATHKLIEISNLFAANPVHIRNHFHFKKETPFKIGDISVTPFWVDHSAFDAYSFLIEADGKSIFYTGDFRGHGRKGKVFKWFTHNAPRDVDYLVMEGTQIGRSNKRSKPETKIEEELKSHFGENMINLVYASGQNIDRIVSIYRACLKTRKILVVDPYIASVLHKVAHYAKIPEPGFHNIRVWYPSRTTDNIVNKTGDKRILYRFKKYKITKEQINDDHTNMVLMIRPNAVIELKRMDKIDGGNFIYSMWEGYMKQDATKRFIEYLEKRGFKTHVIHTSGHADLPTLKAMVDCIKPKQIVPIHTFNKEDYKTVFNAPVLELSDHQIVHC